MTQLHFARSEFARCLQGVSDDEALRRFQPLNCISWIIGHLANQENVYWVEFAQGITIYPGLNELVGYGKQASSPPLVEMWQAWREITSKADQYLFTLDEELLYTHLVRDGRHRSENIGTMLMRNIYHYWFHTGEAHAVRQLLGHRDLPQFVGDMSAVAYQPK